MNPNAECLHTLLPLVPRKPLTSQSRTIAPKSYQTLRHILPKVVPRPLITFRSRHCRTFRCFLFALWEDGLLRFIVGFRFLQKRAVSHCSVEPCVRLHESVSLIGCHCFSHYLGIKNRVFVRPVIAHQPGLAVACCCNSGLSFNLNLPDVFY